MWREMKEETERDKEGDEKRADEGTRGNDREVMPKRGEEEQIEFYYFISSVHFFFPSLFFFATLYAGSFSLSRFLLHRTVRSNDGTQR